MTTNLICKNGKLAITAIFKKKKNLNTPFKQNQQQKPKTNNTRATQQFTNRN